MKPLKTATMGALALALALGGANPAHAWSAHAHRLIAELAYERLSPAARAELNRLIASGAATPVEGCPLTTLDEAATWSDCVRKRPTFAWTAPHHYDARPVCETVRQPICPEGLCATGAINRYQAELADRRGSDRQRLEALAFLTHAIEDIHQPLHAADNGDRIGVKRPVTYLGQTSFVDDGVSHEAQLHWVWDEPMVEALLAQDGGADAIRALAAQPGGWRTAPVERWSEESYAVAVTFVYPGLGVPPRCVVSPPGEKTVGPRLSVDAAYVDAALPIIRERLARAVVRLADRWEVALAPGSAAAEASKVERR